MDSGAVFVATLSIILLILLIISTLRWWRKRIATLNRDLNSNNTTDNDNWIFSIERGTDRQLIRYSTNDGRNLSPAHTNYRNYATSEKSFDGKMDDGLPSYDEAIQAQQQHDIKTINSNAVLAGSVV